MSGAMPFRTGATLSASPSLHAVPLPIQAAPTARPDHNNKSLKANSPR
jgi:hypothetical protein